MKKRASGFTLIEILIVVAVIGILASVVLVGLGPVQRQGRDTRRIADLRSVQTALELFFNKNGEYPGANDAAFTWDDLEDAIVSGGIGVNRIPNDPRAGAGVQYEYGSDGTSYVLKATLEDGNNPAFADDVDGVDAFGVDCEDARNAYCIEF
ncbi:MAG: type II secretion system protein [Candidatus Liptonbacteria bacterium]|nr:type II secretion system protein [Candidatus Liptonbacteria bacterium]